MRFILFIMSFWSSLASGQSAYNSLRAQFQWAQKPSIEDLQLGRKWYCSGSAEAAKGLFRYVREWELDYQFYQDQGQIINHWRDRLVYEEFPHSYRAEVEKGWWEDLRVNKEGHLIVEISSQPSQNQKYGNRNSLSTSISFNPGKAQLYIICEHPDQHENENWGEDRQKIWKDEIPQ